MKESTLCVHGGANARRPAPLLSRFDLIFVLLDRPDAERDRMLSEHIMDMHGGATPGSADTVALSQHAY